jgi:dUTP pyrophosphatase
MKINIKKLSETAKIPTYANRGDAGLDLYSDNNFLLIPGDRALVKTGIAIELPEGYEMQIRPRSGLSVKHGITVLNSPGTIDSGYRGEIGVVLYNASRVPFEVRQGERIAQGVIAAYVSADLVEVYALDESERGANGFGSTGA